MVSTRFLNVLKVINQSFPIFITELRICGCSSFIWNRGYIIYVFLKKLCGCWRSKPRKIMKKPVKYFVVILFFLLLLWFLSLSKGFFKRSMTVCYYRLMHSLSQPLRETKQLFVFLKKTMRETTLGFSCLLLSLTYPWLVFLLPSPVLILYSTSTMLSSQVVHLCSRGPSFEHSLISTFEWINTWLLCGWWFSV